MKFLLALLAVPGMTGLQLIAAGPKTPHAKIVVRPGPPVKPTQPARAINGKKSDWGEKDGKPAAPKVAQPR